MTVHLDRLVRMCAEHYAKDGTKKVRTEESMRKKVSALLSNLTGKVKQSQKHGDGPARPVGAPSSMSSELLKASSRKSNAKRTAAGRAEQQAGYRATASAKDPGRHAEQKRQSYL